MSGKEIERKFLVDSNQLPKAFDQHPAAAIRQGYLAVSADGNEVRVRSKGEAYFLTVKDSGELTRTETEVELSADQFHALWPATAGRRVEKTRYRIPAEGHIIEVDVYHESLAGLMTAEVEFSSEAASRQFQPPAWLGAEVTRDARYKNKNLATQGRPT